MKQTEDAHGKTSSDRDPKGISETLHDLKRDLLSYLEKRFELFVIQVTDPVARFISGLFQQLFGLLVVFSGILFIWTALAIYLSELLNSYVLGFLSAGVPLVLVGVLLFVRKPGLLFRFIHAHLTSQIVEPFQQHKVSSTAKTSDSSSSSVANPSKTGKHYSSGKGEPQ